VRQCIPARRPEALEARELELDGDARRPGGVDQRRAVLGDGGGRRLRRFRAGGGGGRRLRPQTRRVGVEPQDELRSPLGDATFEPRAEARQSRVSR